MDMWTKMLQPPITVTQGSALTTLGGGSKKAGSYQIETLVADPTDSVSCDSKTLVSWGEESHWFKSWQTRSLTVDDTDANKNLRVHLERNAEGRAELAVINESGDKKTEIRFPLGKVDSVDASELSALRAGHIEASHKERGDKQETSITVGEQKFLLTDGHIRKA